MISLGHELLIAHVGTAKAQFVEALRAHDASAGPLQLDCSTLAHLDAAGLQLLVTLAMTLQERDSRLQLCGCSAALRERLQLTALADWFELGTEAEAA